MMRYLKYVECLLSLSLLYSESLYIEHIIKLEDIRLSLSRFASRTEVIDKIEMVLLVFSIIIQLANPSLFTVLHLFILIYKAKLVQQIDIENDKKKIFYKKFEVMMFCLSYLSFVYVSFFSLILEDKEFQLIATL